jgi:hypothetical protein
MEVNIFVVVKFPCCIGGGGKGPLLYGLSYLLWLYEQRMRIIILKNCSSSQLNCDLHHICSNG